MKLKIRIDAINDVKEFIRAMSLCSQPADVVCGNYVVDASSILGVLSLDLTNAVTLVIHAEPNEVTETLEAISRFIVE